MIQQSRYPWKNKGTPGTATVPAVAKPTLVAQVQPICLSGHAAAAALSISKGTLETLERRGEGPPSFVLPGGRRRLYPVDLLIRWAAERAVADGDGDDQHGEDER